MKERCKNCPVYESGTCKCKNCDDDCKNGTIPIKSDETEKNAGNVEPRINVFDKIKSRETNSSDLEIYHKANNKIRNKRLQRRNRPRYARKKVPKRNVQC